jgi:hypothetical protein
VDNIEYDQASGDIFAGSVISPLKSLQFMNGKQIAVEGGLICMHNKDKKMLQWEVKRMVNHDGTLLPQISAAVQHGNKVVMGSPFSKGVLVCEI